MMLCHKSYSGPALTLLALAFYVLMVPSWASDSLDAAKQELREQESKVEAGVEPLRDAASGPSLVRSSARFGFKRNQRSIYGISAPRVVQVSRSKVPIELELLVDNDDTDRSKRFDDYGHMRFGKRGGEDQFDDYGHMRFGR